MAIKTIEMNKGDWSGERVFVKVNEEACTVEFYPGETPLTLKFTEDGGGVAVFWQDEEHAFCIGNKDDELWYMYDPTTDTTREDENPYVAAAKMAFNLI